MTVLDRSVIVDIGMIHLQVTASRRRKPEFSPYYWTCLCTAAHCRSLVGRSKWGRTYRVCGSSLAQQPHGGDLSSGSPDPLILSELKIPPPITCSHMGVLTTRTTRYYCLHVLSRNTNLINLHNNREWRKTRKPQVREGVTTCITHVLKTQFKPKVK